MNGFFDFFKNVFDYALVVQVLIISTAVILVLSPIKKDWKGFFFAFLKIFVFFWAEILMIVSLGTLAQVVPFFRGNNFLFGYSIGISVYAIFFCPYNRNAKWLMATSIMAISITTVEIAFNFSMLLENVVPEDRTVDVMGMGKCLFMILVVLFAVLQYKFTMENYYDMPAAAMTLVIGGNVLSTILNFLHELLFASTDVLSPDAGAYKNNHLGFSGLFFFTLYVVNVSSYMLAYFLYRERHGVADLKREKQLVEDNLEMMKMSERNLDYLKKLKHDLGNQFMYINAFLQNGEYDEAKKYLQSLSKSAFAPLYFIDSGNRTIDAVLNMELSKATANGVTVDMSVVVPPRLPFNESELCSIITNLIDNAVEASVRYGVKEPVVVNVAQRTDYLYICVENDLPEGVDGGEILSLESHKKDASEHGMGTQIVKKFAEKYNGFSTFGIEDGKFIAEVMLALEETGVEKTYGEDLPEAEDL